MSNLEKEEIKELQRILRHFPNDGEDIEQRARLLYEILEGKKE